MAVITTPSVTPALDANTTDQRANLGMRVSTTDGGEAVYVRAASTIAQYDACIVLNTSSATGASIAAVPITTTNALTGSTLAIAQNAITSGNYGWLFTRGHDLRVSTLIACQPNVPLFTTSTGGQLDDATVTAGYCLGIILKSSATSASAPPCTMTNAVVRTWGGG